jgi:hypothetical protein
MDKSPRYTLDRRLDGPRAGPDAVVKRIKHIVALAWNGTPVMQPVI